MPKYLLTPLEALVIVIAGMTLAILVVGLSLSFRITGAL